MTEDELRRFEAKVFVEPNSGCWLWTASVKYDGYGFFRIMVNRAKKTVYSHRAAYEHFIGPIGGKCVCHRCDVPACCNPDHLWLGTNTQNRLDSVAKGRAARGGQRHGIAKLTEADVVEIRRLIGSGSTQKGVARTFNVNPRTINFIIRGETWAHVQVPRDEAA